MAGGFFCHRELCMISASIVADRCFVEVTSVKLLVPELYLKE